MNDCITQQSKAQQNRVHISWDILYINWGKNMDAVESRHLRILDMHIMTKW